MKNKIFDKPLNISQPRTDAEIKEAFKDGRIAEIHDSKYNNIPQEAKDKIQKANQYFDENPPKAHTKEEIDSFFKSFFRPL